MPITWLQHSPSAPCISSEERKEERGLLGITLDQGTISTFVIPHPFIPTSTPPSSHSSIPTFFHLPIHTSTTYPSLSPAIFASTRHSTLPPIPAAIQPSVYTFIAFMIIYKVALQIMNIWSFVKI